MIIQPSAEILEMFDKILILNQKVQQYAEIQQKGVNWTKFSNTGEIAMR